MAFKITFDYPLELHRTIHLTATVEAGDKGTYFTVTNIITDSGIPAIPTRTIRKFKDEWVHTDSNRATSLSNIIGKAIDDKLSK
jgi:capsule polysaccharide modification protein KpsS